jgi:DNA repair exonuclease SbcCD ATPase subunit
MFDKVKNKTNDLQQVREELREVQVKRSGLTVLSHQDPNWSEAKVHNLTMDIDKLAEKEAKLLEDLAEIKNSEAFLKEMVSAETILDKANQKLQGDLKVAEEKLQQLRFGIAGKILEGGDPFKLSAEMFAAKDTVEVMRNGLEAISQAYRVLVSIGEVDYIRPVAMVVPINFKVNVPTSETPHVRFPS